MSNKLKCLDEQKAHEYEFLSLSLSILLTVRWGQHIHVVQPCHCMRQSTGTPRDNPIQLLRLLLRHSCLALDSHNRSQVTPNLDFTNMLEGIGTKRCAQFQSFEGLRRLETVGVVGFLL